MSTTSPTTLPAWLGGELRSDDTGETHPVRLYDGILAVSHDAALRDFATRHRDDAREAGQGAALVAPAHGARPRPRTRLPGG